MVEIANYLQRPQHIRSDLVPLLALMVVKMYKVKVTYDTTLSGPLIIKTNNEGTNVKSEFHWYELFYGRIVPTLVKIIERDSSEKASLIAKSHILQAHEPIMLAYRIWRSLYPNLAIPKSTKPKKEVLRAYVS